MLGICLKRYNVNSRGYSYRLNTHVDIPLEMATPHFAEEEDNGRTTTVESSVKLSLQSVVCHRGSSVDSGHYISFTRVTNAGLLDRPAGHSDDMWLRFDDLSHDRVQPVDIKRALAEESPYLLFYKVQPIEEESDSDSPPAYPQEMDSLDLVDQKLSKLHVDTNANTTAAKPSSDVIDWSRRGSADAATTISDDPSARLSVDDNTRRLSFAPTSADSFVGSTSGSIRTLDRIATEPVTPLEERKSDPASRVASNLNRPPSGDSAQFSPQENPKEKRFSMSMSKITSRFGSRGEQKSGPDIVISEVREDGTNDISSPTPALPPPVLSVVPTHSVDSIGTPEIGHVATKQDGLAADPGMSVPSRVVTKEKKRKGFRTKSRRGSGQKGGEPDRECVVM